MIMSNNHRIFISYKRTDTTAVFKIKDQIEAALGEKCWIDIEDIESDAKFVDIIIKAIDNSEIVLFMYSKACSQITDFENEWTVRELNYAMEENKRIVFVNVDDTPLTKWFKFMFPNKQQVNASSSESLEHLVNDLKKWLNIQNTACMDPVTIRQLSANDIELLKRDLINDNSQLGLDEGDFDSYFTGGRIDYIILPLTEGAGDIPSAVSRIKKHFEDRDRYRAAIVCVRLTGNCQMSSDDFDELNGLFVCASSMTMLCTAHIRNELFIALFD